MTSSVFVVRVTGVERRLTLPAGCHGDPAGCAGRCGESRAEQRPAPSDGSADQPAAGNRKSAAAQRPDIRKQNHS